MRTVTIVGVGLLALALVGAAAVGAVGFSVLTDSGYEETSLYTLNTTGPACPTEDPEERPRSGVYSRETPDGRQLSVVDNVTARGAADLAADVSEIGPGRYQLSLSRVGDAALSTSCTPELRYNATMNVSQPSDYTLVVTLNGELRQVLWAESGATSGAAGASSSASAGGAEAGGADGESSGSAGNESAPRTTDV